MKKSLLLLALLFLSGVAPASDPKTVAPPSPPPGELSVREIRYDGRLTEDEARFVVDLDAEAVGKGESSITLFEGNVAILPAKLPDQLKIIREGNRYQLRAAHAGQFKLRLELVARIQRAEPWNQVSFTGPPAMIASVSAQAAGAGMEVQLLSGTQLTSASTNGISRVKGFLGADQNVALRWQGKVTEVARKALLTVDANITAQVTPTVIKYTSRFHYDIVQGSAARLTLALPATQALTRLVGEQIRDWHIVVEQAPGASQGGEVQILTIEFIKPVETAYDLTLYSEQAVESTVTAGAGTSLKPPRPLEVERASGSLTLTTEDTLAEIESLAGLRQVNAPGNALAAYRFNGPFALALKLKRVEPVIQAVDRASARLEETRLVISHSLALNIEKAGIYAVELIPQPGFSVAEVRGEGVEDWKVSDGPGGRKVLRVSFSARVLGPRRIEVQLEQPLRTIPDRIVVGPLRVNGASKETAQIGAVPAPGIQLQTGELSGLREIPVSRLANRADELLAYDAEQPDWQLTLTAERLAARIVADVFNLVTIGDGIVGGSATIRYGLVNQGVQEFKVRLPAHCRNVEFTGPNIRRKDLSNDVWTIGLQDKVWGGYTLVVTYDYQFDAKGATLPVAGVHTVDVERETGSVAVTTAASLQLSTRTASDAVRRLDESELAAADRALISRAVVLAYQYTGDAYDLAVDVKRYDEEPVLEAVADRTQITSVITEAGQMLTQASFMVKNNEKQFQRFLLPNGANLWGCYVNGQPVKPEQDGKWILVSLPRDANRDQAFAVDILYGQTNRALASSWGRSLELVAPRTDVPNTYAEWQLFVPPALRLSGFGGSMSVAEGTTYELLDAWSKFLAFYLQVLREARGAILVIGLLAFLVVALVISAVRRGWSGILTVLAVCAVLTVLGAMLLPALSKAKSRAQRITSINNLRQIGIAARLFSGDNGERLPVSFEEMKNELTTDKVTYDAETGQRFTYLGGGLSLNEITPDSVIAYGPMVDARCNVLTADGNVQTVSADAFQELNRNGLIRRTAPQQVAAQQRQAVMSSQFAAAPTPQPGESGQGRAGTPTARQLRIELPQTGRPFLFTKVLNVRDEPLSIRARVMTLQAFQTFQMAWQSAAFLLGLLVWWWQWRRQYRNSFVLTLALALILGSVGSLLIQWRALHDALIIGLPLLALAIVAALLWRYWPRGARPQASSSPEPEPLAPQGSLPPVAAAIAFALLLGTHSLTAEEIANRAAPLGEVSIASANYSGSVNDRVALLDVTLKFSAVKPNQTIPLFGPDVAVQQFTVRSGDAKLVRDGNNIAVRLGRRPDATVQLKLLARVAGDVTKRQLAFLIPPALSSQVALVLDQPEADVDFPGAISFKRTLEKEKTRVAAVMGSVDRVELLWTPRVKRAAEVAATVFCQNHSLVTIGGGVVNVRAAMDFQVTQGELRQARVRLPAGQRLLRVEGAGIRTWEIKEPDGAPTLVVDLLKGVSPAWRLTVETERALDALPASVPVEVPHALDVKRETGLVALRNAEELGLSVESASDLQRVDAEEFTRSGADKTDGLFSVFRFSKAEFTLRARAEAIQPQIEAVVRNHIRVSAEQVTLSATIDYTIKRAGVFALDVALPAGYRVERVSGPSLLQWTERAEPGRRILAVALKDRALGACALTLELAQSFKELPASLPIVGVHPLNTTKLAGFIAVSAEPGVAAKTESFDGLTEIPAVALPDSSAVTGAGSVLAFKFLSADPKSAPEWKLIVATEAIESWVRAEIVNSITLTETLVSGRALVRYDIANAPVKELRVRTPAGFRNVEITGPNLRSRSRTGDVWRVELQSKVRGQHTLTVTWEQPRSRTNAVDLAGVSADGVERETGWLAVAARSPLQVTELNAADVQRVDIGDFPDWSGRPDEATRLAYRYVRPGYRLSLDTRRFGEAEVLRALVDAARFTTVVAEDGQMMTGMSLTVRNNGRQFLEVELPPGATNWSAFVAGQPVRPSRSNGKLLLPIQPDGADDRAITVELTYVGANGFPRRRGQVDFDSPKFDVPVKNARWELYLPPNYDYRDLRGSMSRELAGARESSASFSLLEYARMEKENYAALESELKRDVTEARRQLAGGNVREATANYNRAKGRFSGWKIEDADVQKLAKDLQSAQASNLISAQNDFAFRNNGQPFPGANAPAPAQPALRYDNAAAEQQWTRLQQAQEMAAAKIQPLHVNLPVRGLRHAFTQVLQTEIGKPMTIRLLAVSSRAFSWPKRIAVGSMAFLALWGAVALVSRMSRRPAPAV